MGQRAGPGAQRDVPPVLFARAQGARIAYQDFGDGPPVIAVPPTAQNIEVSWEWPDVRSMLEDFASFCRWIHFDKRGTGASDRRSKMPGIDERVHDLEAVMDAAGLERAFVYGASEGGPMCLLFAATYPERVEGVILHGAAAYTESPTLDTNEVEERRAMFDWFAGVYGTDESPMVDAFAPSLAGDDDYRAWHIKYERLTTDRAALREMLEIGLGIDVRDVLPSVEARVLLLHRRGDRIIPIDAARETAALLPHATLIEYEGDDHFAYAGDRAWMDDLQRFVTGEVTKRHPAPRPQVMIRTLGRFAVEVDGVEVPTSAWGSRRARQLCKQLVAAEGWPLTREVLFDQLWPDETDMRKLGARLSVQLSTVRRILGGGVIANRETVALDLDEVRTDVSALLAAVDPREIIDLYEGPFLPDDPYEDWAATVREKTHRRFATAALECGNAALRNGDPDTAMTLADRLLGEDAYDANAHRLLVEALLAKNHDSEARRAHGRWVVALSELGVDVPTFDAL